MKKIILIISLLLLFNCNKSYSQWTGYYVGGSVMGMTEMNGNIYVNNLNSVFKSTNSGLNWVTVNVVTPGFINDIKKCYNRIYICTTSGLYYTTNEGNNWLLANNQVPYFNTLFLDGNEMYGGANTAIYKSTDLGITWTIMNNGMATQVATYSFCRLGNYLFAGTTGMGVYISTNGGGQWYAANSGLTNPQIYTLAVYENKVYAGTGGSGVFVTSNNGLSWDSVNSGLAGRTVQRLYFAESNLFAGTNKGIFLSKNGGQTWINRNQGIPITQVFYSFLLKDNYIYAGGQYSYVFKRQYADVLGINNITENLPDKFKLYQNYPNPFNPETNIRFDVAKSNSKVYISVFDIVGKEVAVLVNGSLNAGTYEIKFNAGNLSSGIYFYKFSSGDFSETKKLMIVK